MAHGNLFTTQTPAVTNANDGTPAIATATTIRFTSNGHVNGVRFYATATVVPSEVYTASLWRVTGPDSGGTPGGTLLASKAVAGSVITAGDWNLISFDEPVIVATGILYRAVIHNSAGRYVATLNFFAASLTHGDLTADADGDNPVGLGTLRQGTFTLDSTAVVYPSASSNSASYFVDVQFQHGFTQALGMVVETDATLTLGVRKTKVLGMVTETDEALALAVGAPTRAPDATYKRAPAAQHRRDEPATYGRAATLTYRR